MSDKFCKDCKWFRFECYGSYMCARPTPVANKIYLVTGNNYEQRLSYASTERSKSFKDSCGPEGKFFEPALGRFGRLKKWCSFENLMICFLVAIGAASLVSSVRALVLFAGRGY